VDERRLRLIALNLDKQAGPRKAAAMLYRMYGQRRPSPFGRAPEPGRDAPPDWQDGATLFDAVDEKALTRAKEECARAVRAGAAIITWLDDTYPQALRSAMYPPPVLYVRGQVAPQDRVAVAVVGARKATRDYESFTYDLARRLAKCGVTIVSGLARGIDRAAHEGALAAGGRTIAVLGSGVDVIYPGEHRQLAEQIARQGALVSYFPMGTPPLAHHFPARNWVIAALSAGVVVVQGSRRSGALITANFAAALGREVMAVPGHVEHRMSEGPHELIQDGAWLVTGADDVLRCVDSALLYSGVSREDFAAGADKSLEARILDRLADGPAEAGALAGDLDEDVGALLAALTRLELAGKVRSLGHGRFRLASDRP